MRGFRAIWQWMLSIFGLVTFSGSNASKCIEARMHAPEGYLCRQVKALNRRSRSLLEIPFPFPKVDFALIRGKPGWIRPFDAYQQ